MSWIGIGSRDLALFDIGGIQASRPPEARDSGEGLMPRGTLVCEVRFSALERVPQRPLRYDRMLGWPRRFAVSISAEGIVSVEVRQGAARSSAQLNIDTPPRDTRLRLSYSWDAPGRRGLLSVENLDQELLHQCEFPAPVPVPVEDLREMVLNGPATRIGRETSFVAVSDRIEPVGLGLGVAAGTPVETEHGPQRIERLRLGDRVVTTNGLRPVRWIAKREVPALGSYRPLRLRAPYFGLTRDIRIAPDTRVLVRGAEAEYLFGEDGVLIQTRHLANGMSMTPDNAGPTVWYHHLLLDSHECLEFAGLNCESLFVGSMSRSPELVATTALCEMPPDAIPRHKAFAMPALSDFEARSLVAALAA